MKAAARLYAVQALFQMEQSGQPADRVIREFEDHRFGATYDDGELAEGDVDLFRKLVDDAVNWQAKIDQLTDRALVANSVRLAVAIEKRFADRQEIGSFAETGVAFGVHIHDVGQLGHVSVRNVPVGGKEGVVSAMSFGIGAGASSSAKLCGRHCRR